jgi:hypothetical protein
MLGTAQAYLDAVNAQDQQAATQHTCDAATPGALYDSVAGSGTQVSIGEVHAWSDTDVDIDIVFGGAANDNVMPMPMTAQDGSWCVVC